MIYKSFIKFFTTVIFKIRQYKTSSSRRAAGEKRPAKLATNLFITCR